MRVLTESFVRQTPRLTDKLLSPGARVLTAAPRRARVPHRTLFFITGLIF